MEPRELLKRYFGHSAFRPGQETLIDGLLSGRDVLGVMPTGAGKSMCYQIPALAMEGMTLVISPLISLMADQVAALNQAGVPGAYLNSALDLEAYQEVLQGIRRGIYKLLYVAPERRAQVIIFQLVPDSAPSWHSDRLLSAVAAGKVNFPID